jgi:hypothetical protein
MDPPVARLSRALNRAFMSSYLLPRSGHACGSSRTVGNSETARIIVGLKSPLHRNHPHRPCKSGLENYTFLTLWGCTAPISVFALLRSRISGVF